MFSPLVFSAGRMLSEDRRLRLSALLTTFFDIKYGIIFKVIVGFLIHKMQMKILSQC